MLDSSLCNDSTTAHHSGSHLPRALYSESAQIEQIAYIGLRENNQCLLTLATHIDLSIYIGQSVRQKGG